MKNIQLKINSLEDEWKSPVGDDGVIMLEICCCTFEYVDAIDVVGTTDDNDVVVCSG